MAANEAYRQAAGPRDLEGRTFREAYPDWDEAGVLRLVDVAYRTREPQSASEVPARWYRDGPDRPMLGYLTTMVQPMRRADGTVGGVVFFALDVTDEVVARNAAREISAEREAILEQLPSGVLTVTTDGRMSGINQTGEKILSVSDEIVGKLAWDALTFIDSHGGITPLRPRGEKSAWRGRGVHAVPHALLTDEEASARIIERP